MILALSDAVIVLITLLAVNFKTDKLTLQNNLYFELLTTDGVELRLGDNRVIAV